MNDLQNRFRTLDDIDAPSLWAAIEARSVSIRRAPGGSLVLVTAAAAALIVAIAGGVVSIGSGGPGAGRSTPPGTAAPNATQPVYRTGMWIATGTMTQARDGHTATLLADGRVLVAGGLRDRKSLATAELYDPATGSWTATGNMLAGRSHHSATRLRDGTVLVAGGVSERRRGSPH